MIEAAYGKTYTRKSFNGIGNEHDREKRENEGTHENQFIKMVRK